MWSLDRNRRHLNHGSFGATPTSVLRAQRHWVDRLEANPTSFMVNDLPAGLQRARAALSRFVGATPQSLVFVPNASTGIASVLRSLEPFLEAGDEIVTTGHDYNAVRQMLRFASERLGWSIRVAVVPFPIEEAAAVTSAIESAVGDRTRLILIDHITSPTGLVFPVDEIVARFEPEIPVLVDGAHGPGQVPLALNTLGASWYTGNLHKWVCAPKGAAFLHTRADRMEMTMPTVVSHGFNAVVPEGSSRYREMFDWTGTDDFSPWLVVPDAIEALAEAVPGGWPEIIERNHSLVVGARRYLLDFLGETSPAPETMVGSMAAVPLPPTTLPDPGGDLSPLMMELDDAGYEVIVMHWPSWPAQLLRVSAHLYNTIDDYEALGTALRKVL